MRLQLARALMCPSDLLLLDEPTNHLDLDALVWLEAWLKRYAGTMIVISHDREFLDAVTRVTLHIDNAQLTRYGGNYSKFEEMRAEQLELQQAAYAKQQDKIAHLQKFIDRFKAKASKAKQAQSRVKALDAHGKLAPVLAEPISVRVQGAANLPNPMLAISDASLATGVKRTAATTIVRKASTARCWPASASASWAPTARASPRWSRPSPATCAAGRHHHRRQGPVDRLLRPAGTGRAAPAGRTRWSTWCAWRASWAPARARAGPAQLPGHASTSAATWSSRPWAP
jgi:hypothetical protein